MLTGAAIVAYRYLQGLSQAALAARAGISQDELAAIERGAEQPTEDTARRIAEAVGVAHTGAGR